MKVIKITAVVLVVLVIGFLSIGLIKSDCSVTSSIEVNASPEKCWEVFMNPDLASKWIKNLKTNEVVEGEIGQIGSKFRMVFVENGEEMEMFETATRVVPNQLYEFSYINDFMTGNLSTTLTESGGKTTITFTNDFTGAGMFKQSILALMEDMVKVGQDEQLSELKKLIEQP